MTDRIVKINQNCSSQLKSGDSCCRRQFLVEVESALKELWEEDNFSQIQKNELNQISKCFFEVFDSIKFTSGLF